ncbi:putative copper homeostasis (lipo)protein LpqS [Mycolicibacterium vinylchloridicum]
MSYTNTIFWTRSRAIIALALSFWVVVVATEMAPPPLNDIAAAHGHHAHHALSSALIADTSVLLDHPHSSDASTSLAPDTVAEAILPRPSTALVAWGLVAIVAMVLLIWRHSRRTVVRGPPRSRSPISSGRVLLTRHCISRR